MSLGNQPPDSDLERRRALLTTVYVPAALLSFCQGLLLPTLPLYAATLDISYGWISVVVAAAAFGTLLTDVPAGALVGRLGMRPTMLIGTALVTAGTLLLGLAQHVGVLIGLRMLAGIGTALWGLSRHAYVATAIPVAMRGRAISVFGGVYRIGIFAGPVLGGALMAYVSYRASFLVAGFMAAVALGLAWRFVRPVAGAGIVSTGSSRSRWKVVGQVLRLNGKALGAAAIAQTFAQMIRQGRFFLIPLFGADVLGLNAASVGLVMTVSAILDVSMFIPAGLLMDRFGRKVAAVPSFAVMSVGVAMIPLADGFWGLLLAAGVIGLGNGLGSGTMMTLGADLAPEGATGEFLGVWRLIGDAGAFVGPVSIGLIASLAGLRGSAIVLTCFGIAAALILALLVEETRQTEPAIA